MEVASQSRGRWGSVPGVNSGGPLACWVYGDRAYCNDWSCCLPCVHTAEFLKSAEGKCHILAIDPKITAAFNTVSRAFYYWHNWINKCVKFWISSMQWIKMAACHSGGGTGVNIQSTSALKKPVMIQYILSLRYRNTILASVEPGNLHCEFPPLI